ncbi:NAD(P)-dependent oxidoreductase [Mesorhizobium sp. J428]|uniref:NAD-dependent epimerase/dehydratase family protein n=1 Tax=Mesorhizobium sp. J428 TaxID=2898440 RepID=UPI00215105D0|nr:NAD(P)-dependent oxidoreductase [Mesorhizobium sp. J428]MCR5855675.1 NAD(P)-dependent oxidoreductase [Mesorhizobium sp. J428]
MTVLVTGGTGFVGGFVVEALLRRGDDVRVMGRAPGCFSAPVGFVRGSLDPGRDMSAAFDGVTRLVHAAFDHVPGRYRGGEGDDPKTFRHRNLDGSVALFQAAKRAGVERAVFLSSRAVYGVQPPGANLTEQMEPHPDTLYGEVKLAAERALAAMSDDGFRGVSLRVTGVYGPDAAGRPHKWSDLFDDYLTGWPVEPRRATEVHGDDVAAAVLAALDAPEPPPVLNVSDILLDRNDLLAIVQAATGSPHQLPPRSSEPVNAMDCALLRSLGWQPGGRDLLDRTVRAMF